jgi:arylamine N-acetyltransferase
MAVVVVNDVLKSIVDTVSIDCFSVITTVESDSLPFSNRDVMVGVENIISSSVVVGRAFLMTGIVKT